MWYSIRAAAVLPDSFFIGPAPRLVQKHHLRGIQLLSVRRLLFSSLGLIYPDLWNIPYCEYTSAEAVATCLATVTRLKSLSVGFFFPRSGPASTYSPPPMHIVFFALTHFVFGMSLSPGEFVIRTDPPLAKITGHSSINYCLRSHDYLRSPVEKVSSNYSIKHMYPFNIAESRSGFSTSSLDPLDLYPSMARTKLTFPSP